MIHFLLILLLFSGCVSMPIYQCKQIEDTGLFLERKENRIKCYDECLKKPIEKQFYCVNTCYGQFGYFSEVVEDLPRKALCEPIK